MPSKTLARTWNNPWLLLSLCTVFWASNVIAARIAPGEVTPGVLACARWLVPTAVLLPFTWRSMMAERAQLLAGWRFIFLASFAAYTLYSVLFFGAGTLTSGVNIAMLCAVVPVFTIVFAWIFLGMAAGPVVLVALALAVSGALIVATRGDLSVILSLGFNAGDLMMIAASTLHAGYTVSLRKRPPLSPLVFFSALCLVALLTSIPIAAVEIVAGKAIMPTGKGLLILVYVGIFPTLLAQLFYMRGVEIIGPQRTGLFYNFVPVSGALMAVGVLGEPFAWYHATGFLLVLAGIVLAERWRVRHS